MDFSSEEEVKKALKCNREYMGKDPGAGATSAWLQGFVHPLTPHIFIEGLLCAQHYLWP